MVCQEGGKWKGEVVKITDKKDLVIRTNIE